MLNVMRVLIVAKSNVVKPGRNLTYPDRLRGRVGSFLPERTGADQPTVPSQHYRTNRRIEVERNESLDFS